MLLFWAHRYHYSAVVFAKCGADIPEQVDIEEREIPFLMIKPGELYVTTPRRIVINLQRADFCQ